MLLISAALRVSCPSSTVGGVDGATVELGIEGVTQAIPIGAGGAATVYSARQERMYRDVAVKLMHAASNEATLRRFEREVQALGELSGHAGIVAVHEVGRTAADQPFIVMQLCPNGSLDDRLQAQGRLGTEEACGMLAIVADTLADAHDKGIVHRDIKPGNILINDQNRPLVADFGIAALESVTGGVSTAVAFSPGFVPPETLDGSPPTSSGDVYSLGATLYALTTGRVPYSQADGDMSLLKLIARMTADEMDDPRELGVSNELSHVIEQATQRDASARPTMREFAAMLRARRTDRPPPLTVSRAPSTPAPIRSVASAAPAAPTQEYTPPPKEQRRFTIVAGLMVVAAAAIAVAATLALTRGSDNTVTTADRLTSSGQSTGEVDKTASTQAPEPTEAPTAQRTNPPEPTSRPAATATPRPEPTAVPAVAPALIESPDCRSRSDLLFAGRSSGGGQSPNGTPGDIRMAICVSGSGNIEYYGLNLEDGLDIQLIGCEQASGVWVFNNDGHTYQIIDQSVGSDERASLRLTTPNGTLISWPINQAVSRNPSVILSSGGRSC